MLGKMRCLLVIGAIASAAPSARALTSDFNFTATPATTLGDSKSFTSGGVSVNVSAITTDGSANSQTIWQSSNGLGIFTTDGGGVFQNQVDNIGVDEALVFDFGNKASFESITLSLVFEGFLLPDDQFQIWGGHADPTAGFATYSAIASAGFVSLRNGNGCPGVTGPTICDRTLPLSGLGLFRYLIVAAPGTGGSNDSFAVKSIKGVSPVPGPAALPLLASALAGFAWFRRRQLRAAA
jgi:hypothetical protein